MVVFEFTKFGKHCVLYSETIFYYNHRGQGEGFGFTNPIFVDGNSGGTLQSNIYCLNGNWCSLYPDGIFSLFFFPFFILPKFCSPTHNCVCVCGGGVNYLFLHPSQMKKILFFDTNAHKE